MGWFDEQIKQRKKNDENTFIDAFTNLSDAVLGTKTSIPCATEKDKNDDAISRILKYYKVKPTNIPDTLEDFRERLEYQIRPAGIMFREVSLEKGWYKDAVGALLGTRCNDGSAVALIPKGLTGYAYYDTRSEKWKKITKKNASLFNTEAICFYKPFPLKKLTLSSLARYIAETLSAADLILIALATLATTAIGLLGPKLNSLLMGTVANSKNYRLLLGITVFMISVSISTMLIESVKSLLMTRINTKMSLSVQAATMMRVMSLPPTFFKKYSAGELSSRTEQILSLSSMIVSTVLGTTLTSLFSLLYIFQIFAYAPALVIPALCIILATLAFSLLTTFWQMRYSKKRMEISAKESGMTYAMITGVQKIKLAGAEKRMFARWSNLYANFLHFNYHSPIFLRANAAFSAIISSVGMIVMYSMAVKSGVSVSDYYAFNTAYGIVSGAFLSLVGITTTIAQFKPALEMAKPIMETLPEISEGKQVIDRLTGEIEISNLSFRYNDTQPYILNNLSLKIQSGQYVAIVGTTGCGKSTLMRILLGFEKPQKGSVYYDGKDISTVDLKSLRQNIGVVMQNGSLFQGDIYTNIVISSPQLTVDQAWEAAEIAGIAEDIRNMPMGMHTMISEGSGGVSGGQKQRLMIARAVAPKPKILMLDEATSALDNITQKIVSDSLDQLKCTRIVIAHRLSTIKQCNRILYLENGNIVEDGTYDTLIAKNGKFAELVERQRLE